MMKSIQFVHQQRPANAGGLQPCSRLFCFPFAGGSPAVFSGWGQQLGPEIEVFAAHPRGRGMRFRERPDTMVQGMVEDFLSVVETHLELPYVFYGHSLGGLIAFEITRQLEARGLRLPERLILGASAPPHLGLIHEAIHHLPDPEFIVALQERYAGIPQEVLREPELLAMFLPALKADFTAYELYRFAETAPVNCPISVFAGESDPGIRPSMLEQWARHTVRRFHATLLRAITSFWSSPHPLCRRRFAMPSHRWPYAISQSQIWFRKHEFEGECFAPCEACQFDDRTHCNSGYWLPLSAGCGT